MTLHKRYDAALKRWVSAEKRIEAAEEKIFSAFLQHTSVQKTEGKTAPLASSAKAVPPKQAPKK